MNELIGSFEAKSESGTLMTSKVARRQRKLGGEKLCLSWEEPPIAISQEAVTHAWASAWAYPKMAHSRFSPPPQSDSRVMPPDFLPVPERRRGAPRKEKKREEGRGGNLKGNILSWRRRRDWIRYKVIGRRRRRGIDRRDRMAYQTASEALFG